MSFFEDVYSMCKKIPKGTVATYGQIACLLGKPRAARQVGWALHSCPANHNVPCHRILNRFGHLCNDYAFGSSEVQKELLEAEGIEITADNTVDLTIYLWDPN